MEIDVLSTYRMIPKRWGFLDEPLTFSLFNSVAVFELCVVLTEESDIGEI
jgi:hypothetical protein